MRLLLSFTQGDKSLCRHECERVIYAGERVGGTRSLKDRRGVRVGAVGRECVRGHASSFDG